MRSAVLEMNGNAHELTDVEQGCNRATFFNSNKGEPLEPYFQNDQTIIFHGDSRHVLSEMPEKSVHCCVTSPPYFNLRNYQVDGQIGLEPTPEAYVAELVSVFRGVWRVLRDDGTVWLNLGDSYASDTKGSGGNTSNLQGGKATQQVGARFGSRKIDHGLKPKDLIGIPWLVAFALRADGWYLRSDIIWQKPNPMPESVNDRPTKSHEFIFLLSKSQKYFYDAEAIKEPAETKPHAPGRKPEGLNSMVRGHRGEWGEFKEPDRVWADNGTRNRRDVWTVATQPYSDAHFATFPQKLIEPCVLAGCPAQCCRICGNPWERVLEKNNPPNDGKTNSLYETGSAANRLALKRQAARERGEEFVNRTTTLGFRPTCDCNPNDWVPGIVLDPFSGAGTTGIVAGKHNRNYIGIELNEKYIKMSLKRFRRELAQVNMPLFF